MKIQGRLVRGDDGREFAVDVVDSGQTDLDGLRVWVAWPQVMFDASRGDRLVVDELPEGATVVFSPEDVAL